MNIGDCGWKKFEVWNQVVNLGQDNKRRYMMEEKDQRILSRENTWLIYFGVLEKHWKIMWSFYSIVEYETKMLGPKMFWWPQQAWSQMHTPLSEAPVAGRHSLSFLSLLTRWDKVEIIWPPSSEIHMVHGDSTFKSIIKNYIIIGDKHLCYITNTTNSPGQKT